MAYSNARSKASRKYEQKHMKKFTMSFQKDEDADIIDSIERAKQDGITKRQWLRDLFNGIKY